MMAEKERRRQSGSPCSYLEASGQDAEWLLHHCDGLYRARRHRRCHRGEPGGASAARDFRVVESGIPPRRARDGFFDPDRIVVAGIRRPPRAHGAVLYPARFGVALSVYRPALGRDDAGLRAANVASLPNLIKPNNAEAGLIPLTPRARSCSGLAQRGTPCAPQTNVSERVP